MNFVKTLLLSLSLTLASNAFADDRRSLVTVGPQVAIGFGDACTARGDTLSCGPGLATSGIRAAASTRVNSEVSFGMAGSIDRPSSGNFDFWRASALGLWNSGGKVESGRWASIELGVISTTAIAQLGGGTKTFQAPHLGFNWGHAWNPTGGAVLGLALQGAVSVFSIDNRSTESFQTVWWLGVATSVGYAF